MFKRGDFIHAVKGTSIAIMISDDRYKMVLSGYDIRTKEPSENPIPPPHLIRLATQEEINNINPMPKWIAKYRIGLETTPGNNVDNNSLPCEHNFKSYVGFTEVYDYCINCDVKKRVPK